MKQVYLDRVARTAMLSDAVFGRKTSASFSLALAHDDVNEHHIVFECHPVSL